MDRRSFLKKGTLGAVAPILAVRGQWSNKDQFDSLLSNDGSVRRFIAHRGVNLHRTIAGENSLESVRLAKRAGFQCVELDVRLTSDGHLVVMHDETLNRTVLNVDGSELADKVYVSRISLEELKSRYVLKADNAGNRTKIPELKEFLRECKRNDILPFIEIKLFDMPSGFYRKVLETADKAVGRGNYVITSNNQANDIIRKLGIRDVRLMGILYQTTFEKIEQLGNAIMAVSATRFSPDEYAQYVARADDRQLLTESHADRFREFDLLSRHEVDYVSTDLLAPDISADSKIIQEASSQRKFKNMSFNGKRVGRKLVLNKDEALTLDPMTGKMSFGGIFMTVRLSGSCHIHMGSQEFKVENAEQRELKYQVMIYNAVPVFRVISAGECTIDLVDVKVVQF